MPAVVSAFQFDHDQIGISVDRQQVDPAPTVVPVGKLLGNHQGVGSDDLDLVTKQALQVAALFNAKLRKDCGV